MTLILKGNRQQILVPVEVVLSRRNGQKLQSAHELSHLSSRSNEVDAPKSFYNTLQSTFFGATCRNLHTSYFDRREVCLELGALVRRLVEEDSKTLDRFWLRCRTCDA